jgi:predicted NAD-dependent protein-ADP-ribosyltransferase YbiA (DUF1768 family)
VYFKGKKHPLSNCFPCNLEIDDSLFYHSEGAYQFMKVSHMANSANTPLERSNLQRLAERIKKTKSPSKSKSLGKIMTNHHWKMKLDTMNHLVEHKVACSQIVKETLENTDNKCLIENTDNEYWAGGKDGHGLQVLGRILEGARMDMRREGGQLIPSTPLPKTVPLKLSHVIDYGRHEHKYFKHTRENDMQQQQNSRHFRERQVNISNDYNRHWYQPRCDFCSETGHLKNTCQHRNYVQCYQCSGWGHKSNNCPST